MRLRGRLGWTLAIALGLFVTAALAGIVSGGPLDPPGTPGPTRKPLDEVLSAWNQLLPSNDGSPCASSRFLCVMQNDYGVLDRETGLVWQRYVSTGETTYQPARMFCYAGETGGRLGWRLPAVEELASLVEPNAAGPLYLPAGHPFVGVVDNLSYWTSNTMLDGKAFLFSFNFGLGAADRNSDQARYWCVRGGSGFSD